MLVDEGEDGALGPQMKVQFRTTDRVMEGELRVSIRFGFEN